MLTILILNKKIRQSSYDGRDLLSVKADLGLLSSLVRRTLWVKVMNERSPKDLPWRQ